MTMRPILFKTPMVLAIEDGSKTQTRRVIKIDKSYIWENVKTSLVDNHFIVGSGMQDFEQVKCPYGEVGDILWVREKWLDASIGKKDGRTIIYFASESGQLYDQQGAKWKPSIFMPKSACRIFLKITDIRSERLQEISVEDAKSEGLYEVGYKGVSFAYAKGEGSYASATGAFMALWISINGKDSWKKNPWLWVLDFEKTEQPAYFLD